MICSWYVVVEARFTLNDINPLGSKFLSSGTLWVTSQGPHEVWGGRTVGAWLQKGIDDCEALSTGGTDDKNEFLRRHGMRWGMR